MRNPYDLVIMARGLMKRKGQKISHFHCLYHIFVDIFFSLGLLRLFNNHDRFIFFGKQTQNIYFSMRILQQKLTILIIKSMHDPGKSSSLRTVELIILIQMAGSRGLVMISLVNFNRYLLTESHTSIKIKKQLSKRLLTFLLLTIIPFVVHIYDYSSSFIDRPPRNILFYRFLLYNTFFSKNNF